MGSLVSINLEDPYPNTFQFWPTNHVRGGSQRTTGIVVPSINETKDETHTNSTARTSNNTTATVFLRYNNMLYADFIAPNELLVIEQPWMYVVPTLPDAIERRIYGT